MFVSLKNHLKYYFNISHFSIYILSMVSRLFFLFSSQPLINDFFLPQRLLFFFLQQTSLIVIKQK